MSTCCDDCLRRAHLVGFLAPWIADRLRRRERLATSLLALPEPELIAAAAPRRQEEARDFLDRFDHAPARAQMERAGLHAVCAHSRMYPESLRALSDPPAALFATSTIERLEQLVSAPAVAIVGARRCSSYAREVAYELGRGLAAAGVTVVSGLARGIDAEAHRGAVDAGGAAVAVLAGGADVPYPRGNRMLYAQVRAGGAVVSELPPGKRPVRWAFPARNRIMAGLARMTVIVEAAERSGSLITAEFASDLGRDVCAVPGWVTSRMAEGSNRLLREGAHLVRGAEDVLDLLFGVGAAPAPVAIADALEPQLRSVLDAVECGEGVEGAARETELSAAEVRAALGRLELLGLVTRDGIGAYRRTARR